MNLLEILIALFIVGLLTSLSIFSFRHVTYQEEINLLKRTLKEAFYLARAHAETDQTDIGLCLIDQHKQCDRDGQHGLMVFSIDPYETAKHRLRIHRIFEFNNRFKGRFRLSSYPIHRSYLQFSNRPFLPYDNGHISFYPDSQKNTRIEVKINKAGRIE